MTYGIFLAFGSVMAQVDPPAEQTQAMPRGDTTSTNTQLKKESDIKTMDAVKTQDHPKVTPKPHKDSVDIAQKKNRSATRRKARP